MRFLLVGVIVCLASTAFANDTNYQNYITGGRSAGLGGAFTAIGNDLSGLLFNPAGIVDDRHNDVSLSANLYGFERTDRGGQPPAPIPNLLNISQVTTELLIIPSVAGAVRTFQKDPNGPGYLNGLAFGVFVPSHREAAETVYRVGDTGTIDYKRRVRDRLFMPGFGYARKLGPRFRLGLSTFFLLRTVDTTENIVSIRTDSDPNPYRSADSTISLTAGSLAWNLGFKFLASDSFHLGLAFMPPSIPVFSSVNVRYYRAGFEPSETPSSEIKQVVNTSMRATYLQPAVLRFGGAFFWRDRLTISGDVSLNFPISYSLVSGGGVDVEGVLPIVQNVQRSAVVNLNLGAELLVTPNVAVSAGAYTDFASSPELSGPRFEGILTQQYLSHIDLYGVTAGLGFFSQYSITRVGAMYAFGSGYDVVTKESFGRLLQDSNEFERVAIQKSFFYVFVSTTVRFE